MDSEIRETWIPILALLFRTFNPWASYSVASRGVQSAALQLHAAQDGYECGPTQNRKFT